MQRPARQSASRHPPAFDPGYVALLIYVCCSFVSVSRHSLWHVCGSFCGSSVALVWQFCGTCVAALWQFCGTSVALARQLCGTCVAALWQFRGASVALLWHFCGLFCVSSVALLWQLRRSPEGWPGDSFGYYLHQFCCYLLQFRQQRRRRTGNL